MLRLGTGSANFSVVNSGSTGRLVIRDNTNDLLSIDRDTGLAAVRGDLTVGGEGTAGAVAATIRSTNDTATLVVESGGATSNAGVVVKTREGQNASLTLEESPGKSFSLVNHGAGDRLVVTSSGDNELLAIGATTGATSVRGDLTVGGTVAGPVSSVIRSTPGDAWQPRTSLDAAGGFATSAGIKGGSFKVCYATRESLGDGDGDFVELPGGFLQSRMWFGESSSAGSVSYRFPHGSGPSNVSLAGALEAGGEVYLQKGSCEANHVVGAARTPTAAVAGATAGHASVRIDATLATGSYHVCYRGNLSAPFTPLAGMSLQVVPLPGYSPTNGKAGQSTTVTLPGAAVGDLVVLQQAGSCAGAANATAGRHSMGKASLGAGLSFTTGVGMLGDGSLKLCYATRESQGDTDSDYIALGDFVQSTLEWSL